MPSITDTFKDPVKFYEQKPFLPITPTTFLHVLYRFLTMLLYSLRADGQYLFLRSISMHSISINSPQSSQTTGDLIIIEHLSRKIESKVSKTVILDDITFAIPQYSLFSINGPSGSGKSTILNMIAAIDRPSSGRIIFAGQELGVCSEDQLAGWRGRHIGIVFQFFQLIPTLTALENVLLALELGGSGKLPRRKRSERAHACLSLAQVQKQANRFPGELSGGEQQRVAIARALANDPPVIIADEPTGNLDSQTASQVFATLAGLRHQGKTIIYVTHDRTLAAQSSARIDLLDGRIVGAMHTRAIIQRREQL
jgi:putative ABC transport system ATP-binding protein